MSFAFKNGGARFLAIGEGKGRQPALPVYEILPVPEGGHRLRLTAMPFPGCLNHMPYATSLLTARRRRWRSVRKRLDLRSPAPTLPPMQHLVLSELRGVADWKSLGRTEAVRRLRAMDPERLAAIESQVRRAPYPVADMEAWEPVPDWAQYP